MKNKKKGNLILTSFLASMALISTNHYVFATSSPKLNIEDKVNVIIRKTYRVDWNISEDGMNKKDYLEKFANEIPNWTYNEREDMMEGALSSNYLNKSYHVMNDESMELLYIDKIISYEDNPEIFNNLYFLNNYSTIKNDTINKLKENYTIEIKQ